MTPRQQDKLASLMLEDLREILKAEVDENLSPSYYGYIGSEFSPEFYENLGCTMEYGTIYNPKLHSVLRNPDTLIDTYILYPSSSGVIADDLKPSWRKLFLDCFGLGGYDYSKNPK
jgi:hypothetical protein